MLNIVWYLFDYYIHIHRNYQDIHYNLNLQFLRCYNNNYMNHNQYHYHYQSKLYNTHYLYKKFYIFYIDHLNLDNIHQNIYHKQSLYNYLHNGILHNYRNNKVDILHLQLNYNHFHILGI